MPIWAKGQSGNPNGRPSNGGIKALLRKHEKEAIDCLVRLMKGADSDKVSLGAAQTILAYIHGKPADAPPAAAGSTVPMMLGEAQLEAAEAALLEAHGSGESTATSEAAATDTGGGPREA